MGSDQLETVAEPAKPKRQPKPKNVPPPFDPWDVINRAKARGIREVIVSFSGGKESLAALDVCAKHFNRVEAFFMYFVRGLSFQEDTLQRAERRYGIKIHRMPDFRLARHLKHASFRHETAETRRLPTVKLRHIHHAVRAHFGNAIQWIATGETGCEAVTRQGMIRSCQGVDTRRGCIYPIGYWRPQDVMSYLSMNGIALPPEYDIFGTGASFGCLRMEHMDTLAKVLPEDFQKVKAMFPLIDVQLARWRVERGRVSENP